MPVLEEMPLAEKVTRANVLLRTRPRDVEETLLQLINEDNQILAAAAIAFVEDRKIWSLAGDLEHVLAHRDPNHWHVFEAASWALAASRMPDVRRRTLWVEPLPSVQLASRLRLVPLFASVSVDELFRLAGAGRQVRHEAAATLYQEGAVPDQVQFLLDGKVTVTRRGQPDREVAPPAALALEQVLEGTLSADTVRTTDPCVCLVLSSDAIRTLIADNTDLMQGLLRMLANAPQRGDRTVVKGQRSVDAAATSSADLKPIEKVLVLQAIPLFSAVTPEEMLHLAAIAREVPLAAGSALATEAEPAAAYVILDGEVAFGAAAGRAAIEAHRGDVIGIYETLAGTGIDRQATVRHAGRALRIEREELFDTLAMRPHLLEQLFDALLRREGDAGGRGRSN
jgi:CRP-like cAMP-binding protein